MRSIIKRYFKRAREADYSRIGSTNRRRANGPGDARSSSPPRSFSERRSRLSHAQTKDDDHDHEKRPRGFALAAVPGGFRSCPCVAAQQEQLRNVSDWGRASRDPFMELR